MRKHSLFIFKKIQILKQISKKTHWKTILAQAKHQTSLTSHSMLEVLRGRLRDT